MHKNSFIFTTLTLGFILIGFIQIVLANPVIVGPNMNPFIVIPLFIVMYILGAWIEYAYFNANFFKKSRIDKIPNDLFGLFLKINLYTFPLTQILGYLCFISFGIKFALFIFSLVLIEIGVVFIESYLLRYEFQKLIEVKYEFEKILGKMATANFLSFLLSLFGFMMLVNYYN